MGTHLSFKAGAKATGERITFDVDGTNFNLVENPSILPLLSLGSLSGLDLQSMDAEEIGAAMGAIWDFFAAVMERGEWRRFQRFAIRSGLDENDLLNILKGIVPELMGRPTKPPADSQPLPSTSSTTGTDGSHSAAATIPVS